MCVVLNVTRIRVNTREYCSGHCTNHVHTLTSMCRTVSYRTMNGSILEPYKYSERTATLNRFIKNGTKERTGLILVPVTSIIQYTSSILTRNVWQLVLC